LELITAIWGDHNQGVEGDQGDNQGNNQGDQSNGLLRMDHAYDMNGELTPQDARTNHTAYNPARDGREYFIPQPNSLTFIISASDGRNAADIFGREVGQGVVEVN
jgi:hypothetical protein